MVQFTLSHLCVPYFHLCLCLPNGLFPSGFFLTKTCIHVHICLFLHTYLLHAPPISSSPLSPSQHLTQSTHHFVTFCSLLSLPPTQSLMSPSAHSCCRISPCFLSIFTLNIPLCWCTVRYCYRSPSTQPTITFVFNYFNVGRYISV